jgi:hypothetical protein
VYIGVDDFKENATVEGLEQGDKQIWNEYSCKNFRVCSNFDISFNRLRHLPVGKTVSITIHIFTKKSW